MNLRDIKGAWERLEGGDMGEVRGKKGKGEFIF